MTLWMKHYMLAKGNDFWFWPSFQVASLGAFLYFILIAYGKHIHAHTHYVCIYLYFIHILRMHVFSSEDGSKLPCEFYHMVTRCELVKISREIHIIIIGLTLMFTTYMKYITG